MEIEAVAVTVRLEAIPVDLSSHAKQFPALNHIMILHSALTRYCYRYRLSFPPALRYLWQTFAFAASCSVVASAVAFTIGSAYKNMAGHFYGADAVSEPAMYRVVPEELFNPFVEHLACVPATMWDWLEYGVPPLTEYTAPLSSDGVFWGVILPFWTVMPVYIW